MVGIGNNLLHTGIYIIEKPFILSKTFFSFLQFKKYVNEEFLCKFDFQLFPFDIQKCTLDFGISHEDMQSMDLIQAFEEPRYKGSNEVNQYAIENFKFLAQDGEKGRLIVQFTLKRQLINVFLTTLIPAMLINLVIIYFSGKLQTYKVY